MFLSLPGLLLLVTLGRASLQSVMGPEQSAVNVCHPSAYAAPYDDGLFMPMEDLGVLSADSFTTLRHPSYPHHSVRIKQTLFECDPKSTAYTGYIDVGVRHLFYYFFESRRDPATDDVIMWLNGGPGCASSLGLLMENGPCKILTEKGPDYNPYSWTTSANVFYVDQPIGVGFSYADYGEGVSKTEEAAKDIAAFVSIFFEHFSQFKGRAFHMAGESYGGHYLPIFAAHVYDQNAELVAEGKTPINLKSVIIGNGLVDYLTMYSSYIDVQCTNASLSPPISSISTCVRMKKALPRCLKWSVESCVERFDAMSCSAASDFCESELFGPFIESGLNPYDITKKCEGPESVHCYPVVQYLIDYLSLESTRKLLGVSSAVPDGFAACNNSVSNAFVATLDEYHETYTHVAQLLERGVRTLIYVGTYDWICNWIGNERWTLQMPWSGQAAFTSQPLREWHVDGQVVGKTRGAHGLTYVTVDGAGHMVPYDKPKEALALVQKWLAEEAL